MTNEELKQTYTEQLANRRAANCYDVHEAAQAIALQLGLNEYNAKKLLDDMGQAAFDGALVVRSPRGHDQYAPTSPPKTNYGFDSLTTPDDVNKWATNKGFNWRWSSVPQATTPSPAPVVAVGASGGAEPKSNLPWWQVAHDIHDMAQNIGAKFHSEQKRASNAAIAKEIEKRINDIERSKGRSRTAPNHDTIRGLLTGWVWRPE